MNKSENSASKYYYVGGSVPHNSPSYIKRKADEELYKHLQAGEYCYVLNSRQMGKSSLRVHTKRKLEDNKIICASIDITSIGSDVSIHQWYRGLIRKLSKELNLLNSSQLDNWYQKHLPLPPIQQFSQFVEEVIIESIKQNIVIFIDEIDAVRSLPFPTDDFFAFIRSCYNVRVDNFNYKRLTFCLLGVATPSDLIQDKERTPFNIGKKVHLDGFKLEEALSLSEGLEGVTNNPKAVIENILYWTKGQPFLTQKICNLILSLPEISNGFEKRAVYELVKSKIISDWEAQDEPPHLTTIRDTITADKQRVQRVIGLYNKIKSSRVEPEDSQEEWILRLSGLIIHDSGKLVVRNHIYSHVFNKTWIKKVLAKYQPFIENVIEWLDTGCQDKSFLLKGESLQSALDSLEEQSLNDDSYKFLIASLNFENKTLKKSISQILTDNSVRYKTNKENTKATNSQYVKEKSGVYKINKQTIESHSPKDTSAESQTVKELEEAKNSQSLKAKSAKYEIIQMIIGVLLLLIAFNEGAVKSIMAFAAIVLYIYLNYFLN